MATAADDDDFIDIELNTDFEFHQLSYVSEKKYYTTSPADDLLYKGKLVPLQCLHLPPHSQMVQKLVPIFSHSSTNACAESCNISPSESCRASYEINPTEFFFHWSTDEFRSFINHKYHHKKYSWSMKLKLIKQSSFLCQKIKTLRAYLKALFIKSYQSNSKAAGENREEATKQQCNDNIIRRSFSGVSKCLSSSSYSGAYSLSSSFSVNSNALFDLHLLKKSSSENEISIEAAIAHCKKPFKK